MEEAGPSAVKRPENPEEKENNPSNEDNTHIDTSCVYCIWLVGFKKLSDCTPTLLFFMIKPGVDVPRPPGPLPTF